MALTSTQLRIHCDSFNDENGSGGVATLAGLLGWTPRTMWRKLSGQHKISQSDEMAILALVKAHHAQKSV
jgi:hypothetical protein